MHDEQFNRVRNCPRCGRLYVRYHQPLCPACIEKREEGFALCREYLRDHPETTMKELSEETGVSVREIIQFIIEGRLILTKENKNMFYACERCGASIRAGRLCSNCENWLTSELKQIVQKDQENHSPSSNMRHKYRIYKPKN